jgi:GTP diphosphokinase / guanosine-3',5'-bis(diphosphate) 3'-diphosphatase
MKLDKAIRLAVKAHAGQKDPAGEPYILHPLRVMLRMPTEDGRIAAVLHDVVEDTELTLKDLRRKGLPKRLIKVVDDVSRRPGEDYFGYVQRTRRNPLSRKVKIADLEDNMDWRRRLGRAGKDRVRMARYRKALRMLTHRHTRKR